MTTASAARPAAGGVDAKKATRRPTAAKTGKTRSERPLVEAPTFDDLGATRYLARRKRGQPLRVTAAAGDVRAAIRGSIPKTPGVYGMVDRTETLIYVGMSRQLPERLVNYFVDRPRSAKEHRVGVHARRLLWEPCGHELTALLRELELIQRYSPRFNVKGQPDRGRSGYVYLTDDDAASYRTANRPPTKAKRIWGPLLLTRRIREGVERLNHVFGLRDCVKSVKMHFRDQSVLWTEDLTPSCLRSAVGSCLGPCARMCSRDDYSRAIRESLAYLDGQDRTVLDRIEQEMQTAAADRKYEKAARLRDTWGLLTVLDEQLLMLRAGQCRGAFVYPVPDGYGRTQWLLFSAGVVIATVRKPTTVRKAQAALEMLSDLRPDGPRSLAALMNVEFECETARCIASWFRRHPSALDAVVPVDDAAAVCRELGAVDVESDAEASTSRCDAVAVA